jgi:hypothetical protein
MPYVCRMRRPITHPRWVFSQLHQKGLVYRGFKVSSGKRSNMEGTSQSSSGLGASGHLTPTQLYPDQPIPDTTQSPPDPPQPGHAVLHRLLHAAGQL